MMYALRMALRQFRLHPTFALDHRARARPRHRRRDRRLHHRRLRRAAAAAVPRAGRAREVLGHEPREGPDARSDLAGHLHGLPRAAGVRRRRRLVAARREPARSRPRSRPREDDRDQRQPVLACSASSTQVGAGFPEGRPVLRPQPDRRHQRSALADALQRRPVAHRQADPSERHAVHRRRRHAPGFQFPGRRRRVAAAAVGPHAAQPQRALRGGRGEAGAQHVARAGARGRRGRSRTRLASSSRRATKDGRSASSRCSKISSATTGRRCTCCSARSACCS